MKLGSLFDGIGGWPLAATKFGIEPVWCSEIEKFPQEITKRHFPNMKHLGDITKIDGAKIEPVDIVTIGSPCQDLSIAGKRKGLAGERSGLFRTAIYIVRGMRNSTDGEYPRFVVWENVPGAFSSNKGNDFRAVLEEITQSSIPMPKSGRWAKAGMVRSSGCEVAWRVLDAQYWGVPQRRKRIFLVADFGGQRAGEILFKPESVCRNTAEGSGERKRTAGSITDSFGESVRCLTPWDVQSRRIFDSRGKWPAIYGGEGGGKGYVAIWDMTHADEVMRPVKDGIVPTLNARMGTGGNQVPVVQEPVYSMGHDERSASFTPNKTDPLTASDYKQPVIVNVGYKVRRLTPTECERLQGLPDGYTLINDKKCSDSARYKALGNGMAQPCADFVMQGIAEVLNKKNI